MDSMDKREILRDEEDEMLNELIHYYVNEYVEQRLMRDLEAYKPFADLEDLHEYIDICVKEWVLEITKNDIELSE